MPPRASYICTRASKLIDNIFALKQLALLEASKLIDTKKTQNSIPPSARHDKGGRNVGGASAGWLKDVSSVCHPLGSSKPCACVHPLGSRR